MVVPDPSPLSVMVTPGRAEPADVTLPETEYLASSPMPPQDRNRARIRRTQTRTAPDDAFLRVSTVRCDMDVLPFMSEIRETMVDGRQVILFRRYADSAPAACYFSVTIFEKSATLWKSFATASRSERRLNFTFSSLAMTMTASKKESTGFLRRTISRRASV